MNLMQTKIQKTSKEYIHFLINSVTVGIVLLRLLEFMQFNFYKTAKVSNSDYRKRWRDVISQHPGHSHGYKSVMAALLKANIRYGLFAQMTQNAKIFKRSVV